MVVCICKSVSALEEYNNENGTSIEIRQVKYLNNIVELDHRGVKRITNSFITKIPSNYPLTIDWDVLEDLNFRIAPFLVVFWARQR